ncbi:ABC-type branched-subunit amino acid transport system ATPase component [Hamadaea flava]|uniref:ATP-binding cassette domain-containing protein n=1 Tax=Hamadaea flava TaxID=1742688 RepID=A0ABV8LMW8_9ACTN|nr:ATP-binding cassette domain-containing protein [Hamadaea flava]MCP2323564.1 ABC-type branched-subunit amino acid transport system ATPase component [Hamadaea flava]
MTLRLDGLERRYGGLHALKPVSLTIGDGARHAVIGPNGAGKTTLLHLIAGSLKPTSGRLLLDGTDITDLTVPRRVTVGISRTHQHPAVYPKLTVAEHLTLAIPPRRVRGDHGTVVLEMVGLDRSAATPAGKLSYGQQRLLELAVAVAAGPQLLLLDEPSSGLSDHDLRRLSTVLAALGNDVTVLLVDHNLALVRDVADHVTVLHHGQHLTTGTIDQVRADSAVRQAYLGTPTATTAKTRSATAATLLTARLPQLGHGMAAPELTDVDLTLAVGHGQVVVGPNGAGKTTLLHALAGLHPAPGAQRLVDGKPLTVRHPADALRAGISLVPQGRRLFHRLTVAEHLAVARAHSPTRGAPTNILDAMPELAARLRHRADRLSGGEQQMLALARALLANPRLMLLDEPGEGLAPIAVGRLGHLLADRVDNGLAALVAEPHLLLGPLIADTVRTITDRTLTPARPIDHTTPAPAEDPFAAPSHKATT